MLAVVAIAETDSWWVVAAAFGALILLLAGIGIDLQRTLGSDGGGGSPGRP